MSIEGAEWLLASTNSGKLAEFQRLLKPHGVRLQLLGQAAQQVQEDGDSFVANAIIKARAACERTGMSALADDSGLVVDALDGAPGIFSARYAGEGASDRENLELLLKNMRGCSERTAAFCCALALVKTPEDSQPLVVQAHWHGEILRTPCGDAGFGYDPVFWVADEGCSAAQLPRDKKNRISHRGKAVQLLLQALAR